jgi:putative DNA primase/helicase
MNRERFPRTAMPARDAALAYGALRWPVFPCHWQGERRKRPLIEGGFHAATTGETLIREWWRRWPDALVGVPTGRAIGVVVLDIDVKQPEANGYDTLDNLGFAILPSTPMVHTASPWRALEVEYKVDRAFHDGMRHPRDARHA